MKATTTIKVLGVILAAVMILFGGIGLTGVAAQSAIPGDALYSVKTTIENTRLSLAKDAGDRAQMKLAFAELRLKEIDSLIREGRYREIREAVLAFEANINAAIIELETVSAADPARAAVITQEVTSALTRYAQMLTELATVAPDSVKPDVTRALDTTQIASGLEQINGNDNSSIDDNANVNTNGNLNDYSAVNDNGNVNDNGAVDDSSNTNSNDNGDDNPNGNTNANDNGDDDNNNANGNANDIGDDNSNGGVDDNSNDNGAVDDNSNDNGNDNDGDDDNSGRGSDDDDSSKGSGKDD